MAAKKKAAKKAAQGGKAKKPAAKPAAKKAASKPAKKAAKKPVATKATKKVAKKVSWKPEGYNVVNATMNQVDAEATIAFLEKAFGGKVRMRMPAPNGKLMHSEVVIGDSVIMISDAMQFEPRVGSVWMYVPDVDAAMEKAVAAGAEVVFPAMNTFWGDRCGNVRDAAGNFWGLATHFEDVSPKEMKKRAEVEVPKMMGGEGREASGPESAEDLDEEDFN
jgi:PhnB protein